MQRDQTLISVTNILTTGDVASVSSYAAGEFSLATTVNALKNKALPTLANGMLRYNGTAWVFDNTAYAPIASPTFTGTVTLPVATGLLKATSGVVSIAGSGDLPGGPYLPLAGGTMTGSITSPTPNNILNPTSYTFVPTDGSPFTQSSIISYGSHDWSAYTAPVQEKTADGTTWVADTLATKLFDAYPSTTSVTIINTTTPLYGTRWTWNNVTWSNITKIMLTYAYSGTVPVFNQIVETSPDGTTWTSVGTTTSYDSTRPTIISIGAVGPNAWLRVTMVRVSGTGTIPCNSVQLWSTRLGDQGKNKWNYLPFSWDYNKKLIANTVNADQAYIGKWVDNATYARMGHVSYNTSTGFGYLQTSDGRVFTASGTSVTVRIGAVDLLTTTAAGNTLTGTTTLSALGTGIVKATAGVLTNLTGTNLVLADGTTIPQTTYQPLDADLTAIAALAGTSGLLRKTAANTWSLDTTNYLYGSGTNGTIAVWSGTYTMSNSPLTVTGGYAGINHSASSTPAYSLTDTSQGTDAKNWVIRSSSSQFVIDTFNDAWTSAGRAFAINRTGDTVGSMYLQGSSTYITSLTSAGFVKTDASGLLSVDTNSYLPTGGGVVTGSTTFSAGIDTLSLYVSGSTSLVGGLTGVTDGSSAASGKVGEIISAYASGTSFTGTTAGVSLVSISLPAGSWLVWGSAHITNGASPLGLSVYLSYSPTGTSYINSNTSFGLGYPVANSGITCHNIPTPINSSSTATVYLIGSEVTTGAVAVNTGAIIFAQRIR